jgi:predicted RNase H-like HicB family nuclease
MRREREAKGLPPDDASFNPEKIFAEWRRKHTTAKSSTSRKATPNRSKRLVRQFAILIEHAPESGYLVYCPAVNGKSLQGETIAEARQKITAYLRSHYGKLVAQGKPIPKTNEHIEKIKIAVPLM